MKGIEKKFSNLRVDEIKYFKYREKLNFFLFNLVLPEFFQKLVLLKIRFIFKFHFWINLLGGFYSWVGIIPSAIFAPYAFLKIILDNFITIMLYWNFLTQSSGILLCFEEKTSIDGEWMCS